MCAVSYYCSWLATKVSQDSMQYSECCSNLHINGCATPSKWPQNNIMNPSSLYHIPQSVSLKQIIQKKSFKDWMLAFSQEHPPVYSCLCLSFNAHWFPDLFPEQTVFFGIALGSVERVDFYRQSRGHELQFVFKKIRAFLIHDYKIKMNWF